MTKYLTDQTTDQEWNVIDFQGFQLGYLFYRSSESRSSKEPSETPGQDYITWHFNEERKLLSLAICDGVGSSFQGNIASKYLGDKLVNFFSSHAPLSHKKHQEVRDILKLYEDKLSEEFQDWLPEAKDLIDSYEIPPRLPEILKKSLEQQKEYGSETVFLSGRIDFNTGDFVFAWMGDTVGMYRSGKHQEMVNFPKGNFINADRWSTKSGLKPSGKKINFWASNFKSENINSIILFTDGLSSISNDIENLVFNGSLFGNIHRLLGSPASDDISMIVINLNLDKPLLKPANKSLITNIELQHEEVENTIEFNWKGDKHVECVALIESDGNKNREIYRGTGKKIQYENKNSGVFTYQIKGYGEKWGEVYKSKVVEVERKLVPPEVTLNEKVETETQQEITLPKSKDFEKQIRELKKMEFIGPQKIIVRIGQKQEIIWGEIDGANEYIVGYSKIISETEIKPYKRINKNNFEFNAKDLTPKQKRYFSENNGKTYIFVKALFKDSTETKWSDPILIEFNKQLKPMIHIENRTYFKGEYLEIQFYNFSGADRYEINIKLKKGLKHHNLPNIETNNNPYKFQLTDIGEFIIRAKAYIGNEVVSEWSDPFIIKVIKKENSLQYEKKIGKEKDTINRKSDPKNSLRIRGQAYNPNLEYEFEWSNTLKYEIEWDPDQGKVFDVFVSTSKDFSNKNINMWQSRYPHCEIPNLYNKPGEYWFKVSPITHVNNAAKIDWTNPIKVKVILPKPKIEIINRDIKPVSFDIEKIYYSLQIRPCKFYKKFLLIGQVFENVEEFRDVIDYDNGEIKISFPRKANEYLVILQALNEENNNLKSIPNIYRFKILNNINGLILRVSDPKFEGET